MEKEFILPEKPYNPGDYPAQYKTKREYFAAMSMQAILSKANYSYEFAAKESVFAADALIKALNEIQP